MLTQTVRDYQFIGEDKTVSGRSEGDSMSPRGLLLELSHLFMEMSVDILDIGFGVGKLGRYLRKDENAFYWAIDGIDGFEPNCYNQSLFKDNIYRNVWHGLAQDIPPEIFAKYHVICLLDVIEHLKKPDAVELIRYILTNMNDDAHFFMSTPLWFYLQDTMQEGDLEEHMIGVPATSLMGMLPVMYQVNGYLVGGFIYNKQSLDYLDCFHPITDKGFTWERGRKVALAAGCNLANEVVRMNYE